MRQEGGRPAEARLPDRRPAPAGLLSTACAGGGGVPRGAAPAHHLFVHAPQVLGAARQVVVRHAVRLQLRAHAVHDAHKHIGALHLLQPAAQLGILRDGGAAWRGQGGAEG